MLTSDQLDVIPNNVLKLYQAFEDSVISDIVRRLVKMDYATPTAAWQMTRITETTAVYEDVLKKLSVLTGKSEAELAKTFSKAGVQSMKFDDDIYRAAGLDPLPLNMSPQMVQVLANGLRTTNNLMRNITQSTALSAQRQFIAASDLAYLQVSSGTFSYDQAIRQAVKSVGESGLGVIYPSGKVDKLDVAVRRAVLTGVSKTSGDLQWARADEMGQDLVETSAHIGARPEHQLWQGKIFSRSGTNKKYPDFVSSTGYGTVTGLAGVNCRHSYYPFFEGISKAAYDKAELESYANKTVTYNGKKMTVYEATQEQRAIERQIRSFKRQENALQAGGLDASAEAAKVRDLQAKMRSFTKQTGLSRQGVREQVVVKELKTMSAPKNANANYLPEVVSFPNPSQGQRSPTSAELITFTDRVKSMPTKIRALEPVAPSMRESTKLDGTKKVLVDQVEFNVIQDISKSDLGSAYNRGKALSISDEFIGTPIQDHEYLHTLTYRNHTLRDALQDGKYNPPELFEHAQFAQNKLGEQFTMVMTGYSDDIAKWENDIARLCYFDNPDNLNRAKSQIKAVTEFLKGIGLW